MYKENDVITISNKEQFRDIAQWCNENGLFLDKQSENVYIVRNSQYYLTEQDIIHSLRMQRESECFTIVNRGQLWYDTLTEEQRQDLEHWYFDWLDVTETKVIPIKPSWLK